MDGAGCVIDIFGGIIMFVVHIYNLVVVRSLMVFTASNQHISLFQLLDV